MAEIQHRDTRMRFEQWARNPACTANAISAVHGVPMAEVARAEGTVPTTGQSPFAIARGLTFERVLFRREAEALRGALIRAKVLPPEATGFRDFRLRRAGGPYRDLDKARAATASLLTEATAAATPAARAAIPSILAGPVVRVPGGVMLPEAILVIDVLVVRMDRTPPLLIVGEIKTYPDRGGYTDGGELATARAQAGVYVHGLHLVLAELGLSGALEVGLSGFLVLSRPGSNQPSIRANEDLRFQAVRAERGFGQLRDVAKTVGTGVPRAQLIQTICRAPVAYQDTCIAFCDRAATCDRDALKRGDPHVLGEDVARFLGPTDLNRALALLDGTKPKDAQEEDLRRRIEEAGSHPNRP
jgi:hypothetical protein